MDFDEFVHRIICNLTTNELIIQPKFDTKQCVKAEKFAIVIKFNWKSCFLIRKFAS